jgi:hypothetical protein
VNGWRLVVCLLSVFVGGYTICSWVNAARLERLQWRVWIAERDPDHRRCRIKESLFQCRIDHLEAVADGRDPDAESDAELQRMLEEEGGS